MDGVIYNFPSAARHDVYLGPVSNRENTLLISLDHQKNQQQPPSPDKIYLRLCSQVNADLCLILVDVNAYVTTTDKVNN